MGLDLIPEGKAKPGHEIEWRRIVALYFRDEASQENVSRFADICIPAYESIGAPIVGLDEEANAWIIAQKSAQTPQEIRACLKEFDGYHVIALVGPPGVPIYSNGSLGYGADETSFRGAFLKVCKPLIGSKLLNSAYENKWPEEAVAFGKQLLAIADKPVLQELPKPTLLNRLGFRKPRPQAGMEEQLDIVRAAGEWFVFWGERGHPIRAWA